MILYLITDRTQADVNFAAAHRNSPAPLKGAYNADDYNRVGAAVNLLRDWLLSLGYGMPGIVPPAKDNWLNTDNFTPDDGAEYLSVVKKFRDTYALPTTPAVPLEIQELFNPGGHEKANDIERIMLDVNTMIDNMTRNINLGWALGIAHINLFGGITA